jgi:hypothetical protein
MNEQEKFKLNEIYQRNSMELFALIRRFGDDDKYKDGMELVEWKRQMYVELIELLQNHIRDLDAQFGKHEPKTLYAEAVLIGTMGGDV